MENNKTFEELEKMRKRLQTDGIFDAENINELPSCPRCGRKFNIKNSKYCSECGIEIQKLNEPRSIQVVL